ACSPGASQEPDIVTFIMIQALTVAAVSAFVATAITICLQFYLDKSQSKIFVNSSNCVEMNGQPVCFLSSPLADIDVLSTMTSFYSNLIVLLVALLTITAAFAALTIRASAKNHVENELPQLTQRFFESDDGKEIIKKINEKGLGEITSALTKLDEKNQEGSELIAALVEKTDQIQSFIDSNDFGGSISLDDVDMEEEDSEGDSK
ncbi:hypothetical protein M8994_15485, partial [Brucella sp. 21LCYQ03]|nr:hypothetical protein [Brucella sp. 21LCYQ03]